MEETYEEIVQKWYSKMRSNFTTLLLNKYKNTNMSLSDAENIYQDIFIAIQENIHDGKIGEKWDWRNYIIRIGLNIASKQYRHIGITDSADEEDPEDGDKLSRKAEHIRNLLQELPEADNEKTLYQDQEAQALLGDELIHTPEPCASIIRLSYYSDMTDSEIAESIEPYCCNGKSKSANAKAVKARRWLCMRDLIFRVKMALYNSGIIDEKPVKPTRNGK